MPNERPGQIRTQIIMPVELHRALRKALNNKLD